MGKILNRLHDVNDIKKVPGHMYPELADEIREFLIQHVSRTGGHIASNLGVVEITMALHLCLDLSKDKVIYDVGHQSYIHKLLTGRKDDFDTLRQKDGLCGFPKRKESPYDAFGTGHSSTSLSAALGFVRARELKNENYTVAALIGDGALTGGMAFEALNNMATLKKERKNLIIILNDNKMSIAENVGGMSRYLNALRSRKEYDNLKVNVESLLNNIPTVGPGVARTLKRSKDSVKQLFVPGMLFENMGIKYYGPVDGHDIQALKQAITRAKHYPGPIMIHAITQKGKGLVPAENNPERFHGIDAFDPVTGMSLKKKQKDTYTDVFGSHLVTLGEQVPELVAVTAAMPSGTGLNLFKEKYPDRYFDVGIAEEHAVTFSAGMAAAGLKPVIAIYSSFLQRGYDQLLHDVCIQKLPVVFCVDRSGLVGADGETHQGTFDISYLSHIPNMVVMAPKNNSELKDMMDFAVAYNGPIALKYPRGEVFDGLQSYREPIELGVSESIYDGEQAVILSVGNMMDEALKTRDILQKESMNPGLINVRFLSPADEVMLHHIAGKYACICTMEENVLKGGYGQMVSAFLHKHNYKNKLITFGIPDCFVEHATVPEQRQMVGLDAAYMAGVIMKEVEW